MVSDVKGTTTDPVTKSMELLPLGPVVIIDTPGFDDEGALGEKRVARAKRVMNRTDLAVLVLDARAGASLADRELIEMFEQKQIPYLVICNKADLLDPDARNVMQESSCGLSGSENTEDLPEILFVSAVTGEGIHDLKEKIAALGTAGVVKKFLIEDLVRRGRDTCMCQAGPTDGSPEEAGRIREARTCHHRQPGLRRGGKGSSRGHTAHIFLYFDGKI